MAAISSGTLRKTPRRRRFCGQLAEPALHEVEPGALVGVKWSTKRGCLSSHARTIGMRVGAVVVDDQVEVEVGRELPVEAAQERRGTPGGGGGRGTGR